jgi:hypothetical protein
MKLVLDDFYEDPDALRELALNVDYSSRARNFPGSRSTRTVIPPEAEKAFQSLLKLRISAPDNRIPYNGCFQLMKASDSRLAYVHADTAANWAGLVYLSKKTIPSGGTSFFQHKLTGLSRFPSRQDFTEREFEKLRELFREDRGKPSRWIEIDRVGFVYNRFVLYDAQLFHRNGRTWGSTLATGRLTHNFFI